MLSQGLRVTILSILGGDGLPVGWRDMALGALFLTPGTYVGHGEPVPQCAFLQVPESGV